MIRLHGGKFQVYQLKREFLQVQAEDALQKKRRLHQSYQFGVLGRHAVGILNESLELVVLCEGDDLQHSPELGENLKVDSIVRTTCFSTSAQK